MIYSISSGENTMNETRKQIALKTRISAAELAESRPHPRHIANDDEQKFRRLVIDDCDANKKNSVPSYLASFTKGMPHDKSSGLLKKPEYFKQFVKAIDSGDPRDFKDTPLGPEGYSPTATNWESDKAKSLCGNTGAGLRAWESQSAGNTFDLEGPDAQAVTMPPAPAIGSDELIAEMAEVYAQALLRDVPFTQIVDVTGKVYFDCDSSYGEPDTTVNDIGACLNQLPWFANTDCCNLTPAEASRKRGKLTGQTAFRGITPGDNVGPYVSQFLLAGNSGINGKNPMPEHSPADGYISYGAILVDQRVRYAKPCDDHMTIWDEWFDVQQAANLSGQECYEDNPSKRRFITTPRDMATYVHFDALYEAYLNACLILLSDGIPFDPGIPFQNNDFIDHQQGFAHFGGPHILTLVTEVATRALKAVRFQKYNVHRRLRPEALAARLAKHQHPDVGTPEIKKMVTALQPILDLIAKKNPVDAVNLPNSNYLLPMAFCEGSPMHPSYGAGHATVAGACVTILKAFFDHKHPLAIADPSDAGMAFVANADGSALDTIQVVDKDNNPAILTVEGELNKLASNISIARDWAGVHYFTDYIESLRMGEQIAIGILEEQKLTYDENFSMTVPLFDGGSIRI